MTTTDTTIQYLLDDIRSLAYDRAALRADITALRARVVELETAVTKLTADLDECSAEYIALYRQHQANTERTTIDTDTTEENTQ